MLNRFTYLATVVADIASYLPDGIIAGVVYLAALPYIGPIMGRVGTQTILGMLPALFCEDSVATSTRTAIKFIDTLFVDPSSISWETKALWIGMAACQTPTDRSLSLSRPQDPSKLHELGRQGLPLLIVNGTSDQQVKGGAVVEEMKSYFKDLDVVMISKKGSHAVFYENQDEVMDAVTAFSNRVHSIAPTI